MNILVPYSWLKEFIETKADPDEIAKYLSLCGPSVEKIKKVNGDFVFDTEITTNRVDLASVYGIAREASAILPRFKINASLKKIDSKISQKFASKVKYLEAKVDEELCPRFCAILIKDVKFGPSPEWMKKRLNSVGLRPINNIVDISNYIMCEIGQPVHTFDYDKIFGKNMILRKSKKNEKITTLDGKTLTLPGNDIVIEDKEGKLIDLAGIMGGLNSAIDVNTRNVLLFIQTYNPSFIRRTSMLIAKRTQAASLFEKDLDTELVTLGMARGIKLFELLTQGKPEKEILDIYPNPYKPKFVKISLSFIKELLGIPIQLNEVAKILRSLEFDVFRKKDELKIKIPSFRSKDINIPEDIVEEIARIYGYHNIPGKIMEGRLPEPNFDSQIYFEEKLKNILKNLNATEVYTLSLVSEKEAGKNSLKLKNPLGPENSYLRTSLLPSLIKASSKNFFINKPFHLFEIANVYIPRKGDLPEEKMMLAGIFKNFDYISAKGIVESLLETLNIKVGFIPEDSIYFLPNRRVKIISQNTYLGELGILEIENLIYYEFEVEKLKLFHKEIPTYKPIPKYPAQIEDVSFLLPEKTEIGKIIELIKKEESKISKIELWDVYKNSFTLRIWYEDPEKTLTDKEVEKIRNSFLKKIRDKFAVRVKN